MIQDHGDKFVRELIKEVKASLKMKNESIYEPMLVYGVAKSKEYDLVIHSSFPDCEKLISGIRKTLPTLRIFTGEYASEMAFEQSKRIGLGYNLREEKRDICKKIITICYLALQGRLEIS